MNHSFSYDAENRPYSAGGVTYYYDGEGERVAKSNHTLYLFGTGSAPVVETDIHGSMIGEYVFFNGKRVAKRKADGSVHYYFADQIGSASVVTNATGAMPPEQDIEYHPYGEQQVYTDTLGQEYRFTGHEHDTETNDDYFGARYYSSGFGRFLTPDWSATPVPIPYAVMGNPQTLNLYSYVENNPITGTDPDGHDPDPDITFQTAKQEELYKKIAAQSPSFAREIQAERDDHNMDVNVVERGLKQNDEKSPADTRFEFHPDGTVKATVSLDNAYPRETDVEHEHGHVKDVRENRDQFLKDALKSQDKNSPTRLPHNDRPEEKRADSFKNQVEREKKENREAQKQEQKEQKQKDKEQSKRTVTTVSTIG